MKRFVARLKLKRSWGMAEGYYGKNSVLKKEDKRDTTIYLKEHTMQFGPEIKYYDTSVFYSERKVENEIKIKNSIPHYVLLSLFYLACFIYVAFFIESKGWSYYLLVIFLFITSLWSLYYLFNRKYKIFLDEEGICINNKGCWKWTEVRDTKIKIEYISDSENTISNFSFVFMVRKKEIKVDLTGLNYNFKEVANLVEHYKRKHHN